jgi:hypothetical protein
LDTVNISNNVALEILRHSDINMLRGFIKDRKVHVMLRYLVNIDRTVDHLNHELSKIICPYETGVMKHETMIKVQKMLEQKMCHLSNDHLVTLDT